MRAHRFGPAGARLPYGPHHLRTLTIELGAEAHVPSPALSWGRAGSATPTASPLQKSSALGPAGRPVPPAPLYPSSSTRWRSTRADAYAAPDAQRGQRTLIDPVAHRLLVELQQRRDVGNGEVILVEIWAIRSHFESN